MVVSSLVQKVKINAADSNIECTLFTIHSNYSSIC